ncbi:tektin-B1-like [Labrus mixtus]|uniref:tektin-B1-like n=1 Tax=Labrus mixtus TaxID=508554 RepID=UPI0029BFF8C6|nr:tektin-B1-like [Labrus mixtus]
MWQRRERKEDHLRFSLPMISANKSLWTGRPQLQTFQVQNRDDDIVCSLQEDLSRLPSAAHSTMKHLSSLQTEVSVWQAQISESISRVDLEIFALEMLRGTAEGSLQEKQQYSQLLSNCVPLANIICAAEIKHSRILNELKKEEKLTNEIRDMLQKQICVLLEKISSLKDIRTQLLADFRDKGEATQLTTKCILYDQNTQCSRLHIDQYKPNHVKHDRWLSHCKNLKLIANNLIKVCCTFRGNLRYCLANQKNNLDHLHCSTGYTLRKKIHELIYIQDTMTWDRQRISDEISDLTKDIQRVTVQIRNCDQKLHQATHRLEILNQRPRLELCLDQPHFCLTLEKQDLSKITVGLYPLLKRSQQDLESTRRRLMILDDKLAKNAKLLEVEQKLQSLHKSFYPRFYTNVVLSTTPRLCRPRLALTLPHSKAL